MPVKPASSFVESSIATAENAERIRQIVEGNFGRAKRVGNVMEIAVPADIMPGLVSLLGRFQPIFRGQSSEQAPARVTNAQGVMIELPGNTVTTSYVHYSIDLAPGAAPQFKATALGPVPPIARPPL